VRERETKRTPKTRFVTGAVNAGAIVNHPLLAE
jgi:hypothetical protein